MYSDAIGAAVGKQSAPPLLIYGLATISFTELCGSVKRPNSNKSRNGIFVIYNTVKMHPRYNFLCPLSRCKQRRLN
jgi:hypothetical protein